MLEFLKSMARNNWLALVLVAIISIMSLAIKIQHEKAQAQTSEIMSLKVSLQFAQVSNTQLGDTLKRQADAMAMIEANSAKRTKVAEAALQEAKLAGIEAQKRVAQLYKLQSVGDDCKDTIELLKAYKGRK